MIEKGRADREEGGRHPVSFLFLHKAGSGSKLENGKRSVDMRTLNDDQRVARMGRRMTS